MKAVQLTVPENSIILVGKTIRNDGSLILYGRLVSGQKINLVMVQRPSILNAVDKLPIITSAEFGRQPDNWDDMWDNQLASKTAQ